MDIWNYFEDREKDLIGASASTDDVLFEASEGEQSGRIHGRIVLRADALVSAYLDVTEWVEAREDSFEVVEYSYYLIVNGAEVWGEDKDPSHADMPIHGHIGADHKRVESEGMTLAGALDRAWDELTLAEETGQV